MEGVHVLSCAEFRQRTKTAMGQQVGKEFLQLTFPSVSAYVFACCRVRQWCTVSELVHGATQHSYIAAPD